jgi:putative membrane protein
MNVSLSPVLIAQQDYAGLDGFLPLGRGSFMLDVVFLAMFVVTPLLAASLWLVKARRNYTAHKQLQLGMAAVLLVAVLLFEIDIRVNGWEHRAEPSPYYDAAHKFTCPVGAALIIHLSFAIPTLLLWVYVVVQAIRKFPSPPRPGAHSRSHARLGWMAAVGMFLTAATGWVFYWLAFVAS